MKRYRLATSLALAVLGVLALAGPVAAGKQVPFKGRLEGDVTVTPLAPPLLQVELDATGNATHLGKFTLDIPHVVNPATRTAVGTRSQVTTRRIVSIPDRSSECVTPNRRPCSASVAA